MLGTRALQIFDETTCVVRAALRWTEFYQHESCGKCTPCREGTYWLVQVLERLEQGQGTEEDLDNDPRHRRQHPRPRVLRARRRRAGPITSGVKYFRDEYIAAPEGRRLPVRPGGFHAVGG